MVLNQFLTDGETFLARNRFVNFVQFTKPDYETMWFHRHICQKLEELREGKIKKLMVFTPPQHGKSELVSRRYPAYLLGRDPRLQVAGCSYSADLAGRFNREIQRIIDDPLFTKIFPKTRLNSTNVVSDLRGSWLRNSEIFEIVDFGGSYKSVGVGGPLTGNKVDVGIIDDPIKDRLEAQSVTFRNRLWEWYLDVFCARLHNESKVLLTMTRWNEDDLAGRILSNEKDWEVISFPAIKEDSVCEIDKRQIGEALWPSRHSKEKIEALRALSERTYISMYQQRPSPAEGGLIKRKDLKYYSRTGRPETFDTVIQSWDCSFKDLSTSDFVVGQVWGKVGVNSYLLDMVRGRWSFTETIKQFMLLDEKYPDCDHKFVEDKANGTAVIDVLKSKIAGIVPVEPEESKESRATAVSYVIEAGNVYIPDDENWSAEFVEELAMFPNGKHDDMVDAMTQALNKLYKGFSLPGILIIG